MDASMAALKANGYSFIIFHLLAAVPPEQGKSMECSGLLGLVRLRAPAQELPHSPPKAGELPQARGDASWGAVGL